MEWTVTGTITPFRFKLLIIDMLNCELAEAEKTLEETITTMLWVEGFGTVRYNQLLARLRMVRVEQEERKNDNE